MAVAQDMHGRTALPRRSVRESASGARRLDIRWVLDRRALLRARSGLTSDDGRSAPIELRWIIERSGEDIRARAAIVDSAERVVRGGKGGVRVTPLLESRGGMMRPEPVWIDDGDMVHVDLPGLVVVSLRRQRDGTRLLYARTRLLEEALGLPGGRYEPVSVSER